MKAACPAGPQFLRLTPELEEAPPPRAIGCPHYRACLAAAAGANLALDCTRCPEAGEECGAGPFDRRAAACA